PTRYAALAILFGKSLSFRIVSKILERLETRNPLMEVLEDIGLYIGVTGVYAVVFILALLAVLLPLSAYSAQKWMYKNYLETKSVNAKLSELLELARTAQSQYQLLEDEFDDSDTGRREPTIGKDLDIPL
ncbi:MAG: hypothetical protein ABF297_15870, partial [Thiogranum sp.]